MTAITFDSLNYFERLTRAGMLENLARTQVEVMQEAMQSKELVTKADLELVKKELATRGDIDELKKNITDLKSELKQDINDTKHEIIKWFIAMMFAQSAILLAIMKL